MVTVITVYDQSLGFLVVVFFKNICFQYLLLKPWWLAKLCVMEIGKLQMCAACAVLRCSRSYAFLSKHEPQRVTYSRQPWARHSTLTCPLGFTTSLAFRSEWFCLCQYIYEASESIWTLHSILTLWWSRLVVPAAKGSSLTEEVWGWDLWPKRILWNFW